MFRPVVCCVVCCVCGVWCGVGGVHGLLCEALAAPKPPPREGKKCGGRVKKESEIFGLPTLWGPTLRRHVRLKRARPVQAKLAKSGVGLNGSGLKRTGPNRLISSLAYTGRA